MKGLFASLVGTIDFYAESPKDRDMSAQFAEKLIRSARFASLSSSGGTVRGTVLRVYYPAVTRIGKALGMTVGVSGRNGIYFFLKRYSRRTGLLIGALLAALMVTFFSNIVMRIEISGNETVSDDEILSLLRLGGIYYGSFIPAADLHHAERILLASSDRISWAAVRHSGCRVIVQVSEMTDSPQPVPKGYPCNIVAVRDAQITSMKVYSGMVMPMLGDTVRKGELLISGVVPKRYSGTYYVHAMGEITGRYPETVSFVQPYEDTAEVIGEPYTATSLELFGKRFALSGDAEPEGHFESAENVEYIRFLGLTLPAAAVRTEIYPIEEIPVSYTEEQADAILDEKLKRYENNFLNGGDTAVIDRKITRSHTESCASVQAEYILEGDIGAESIIFADKLY